MSKKITKFLLLSYLISWVIWGPLGFLTYNTNIKFGQLPFMILFTLGGLVPTFAAFRVINPRISKEEFKTFTGQVFKVKVSPLWYLWVLAVPFMLFSIPFIINHRSIGSGMTLFRQPVYMLLVFMISNYTLLRP